VNVSQAYPSKYLKASDLNGQNITITIKKAELEEIGFDQERKLVLSFANTDKSMVLNKTNANTIAKLYGEETDDWNGKRITLCAREVEFQGTMTAALRVLAQKPEAHKKAAPPAPPPAPSLQTEETQVDDADDDLPF
jgi:hypothetical protein